MTEAEFQQLKKQNPQIRVKGEGGESSGGVKPKRRKIAASGESGAEKSPVVAGRIHYGEISRLEILLPIRTVSEANQRDHWRALADRKRAQKDEIKISLHGFLSFYAVSLPCVVRLTRIGAKALDDDNLAISFKAIRDQLAELIGVDDGSEMIRWQYDQVVDRLAGYGVKIEILRPFQAGE